MENLTNMTDDITSYGSFDTVVPASPLFTSLQADNLISLPRLKLEGVQALKSISMAKLEFVGKLDVFSNPTMSLNFPLLKNSTEIQIQGGYSR